MRNLVKLLFQRVVIVSLCLLFQIGVILLGVRQFSSFFPWYNATVGIGALVLTMVIVSKEGDPAYKIAWIIPILAVPVFGVTLYLMFGGNHQNRRLRKRLRIMEHTMTDNLRQDAEILDRLEVENSMAATQAHYLVTKAACPVYQNTATEYFSVGDDCYVRMLEDLRKAEHFIYLEYFILDKGKMWDSILKILQEKAGKGLDVRVIYDDFGCITRLPAGYRRKLEAMGIRCRVYNPFIPIISPRLNNRDHRKLMIVDGQFGFTGGINLADEYINVTHPFGHWKDCGIRLEGDAVWSMTVMFLSMWDHIQRDLREEPLLPIAAPLREERGYVQPFTDSPLDNEGVSETVFLNMISRARKSVYIMTPYLILDSTMRAALCIVAKSGIDVRIITPGIPDKRYVYAVTRANYRELLEAGARIYEYTPGFMHSKVVAVDLECAVVGTVNMDFRSLYLHFEDGVFLYNTESVRQISDDFADTLPLCRSVELRAYQGRKWYVRLVEVCLRVFAPLM
ncbi:MAG: cardiolipin synthase [Oscillospiraceae bacterium]|nr:cardiolipin synthase [Oscillospiraceae bacterium]